MQGTHRLGDRVSGVRVKVDDLDRVPTITRALAKAVKIDGYITDWTQQNATYFRAVQIEKRMMFIILTLIIAVAAFNLVSTLVMVVRDKHADIAILRTLGAAPGTIMRVFMVQGAIVGLMGTLIGVLGGILLAINIGHLVSAVESIFGFHVLDPQIYFLSKLPSDLRWADVWVTALISLVLSLLATVYPSLAASRVNPAEALRYE